MATMMTKCNVHGCDGVRVNREHCAAHKMRVAKYGDPLAGVPIKRRGEPNHLFLLRLVDTPPTDDACVTWPYGKGNGGYGSVSYEGQMMKPSRAICIIKNGPPPLPDMQAAHRCGNGPRGCVHPDHVRWATRQENAADMVALDELAWGERNGHAKLTEESVRFIRANRGRFLQRDLAGMLGVSQTAISHVLSGATWSRLA